MQRQNLVWLVVSYCSVFPLTAKEPITFHRDVLPILQKHCQSCHRPGEVGPMSLLTYQEVRPFAKAIRQSVQARKMPPWFAADGGLHFRNESRLTEAEIAALTNWAETGAKEGNPKDAPPERTWPKGWSGKEPDLIVELPKSYEIPKSGTIEYTYFIMPSGFTEDTWIQAAEFRPGIPAMTHHASMFVRPPGSKWLRDYPVGEYFIPKEQVARSTAPRPAATTNAGAGRQDEVVANYVPGGGPMQLPEGQAIRIPAGSDFVFQFHYITNGQGGLDRTKVGLVKAKGPVRARRYTISVGSDSFAIPPGDPNHRVVGSRPLTADAELRSLTPHMHLRGKAMDVSVTYPDGRKELLLSVPRYDFNWQLNYELAEPKMLPKGSVLEVTALFDNSPNNRHNPDPTATVRWGDQSSEEMMVCFFGFAVDPRIPPWQLQRPTE